MGHGYGAGGGEGGGERRRVTGVIERWEGQGVVELWSDGGRGRVTEREMEKKGLESFEEGEDRVWRERERKRRHRISALYSHF